MISVSYAKISFTDVARKLQLDSPEDAEYIVAKVSSAVLIDKNAPCLPEYSSRPFATE